MARIVKGLVDRNENFIRVFDIEANSMYEFAVNGNDWGLVKVGDTMPNGFVLSQEVFDEWYKGLPKAEETFVLEKELNICE